jgi:hypothetical protein
MAPKIPTSIMQCDTHANLGKMKTTNDSKMPIQISRRCPTKKLKLFDKDGFQEFLKQTMSLVPSVFGWSKLYTNRKRKVCSLSHLGSFTKQRG